MKIKTTENSTKKKKKKSILNYIAIFKNLSGDKKIKYILPRHTPKTNNRNINTKMVMMISDRVACEILI